MGVLDLISAFNQGAFKADATSATDDASALGINKTSACILVPLLPLASQIAASRLRSSVAYKSALRTLVVLT